MNNGIQDTLKLIGNYGCYFLSLLKGCGKTELDILPYYELLIEKKLMKEDCTILNSQKVVEYLIDKNVVFDYLPNKPKKEYDLIVEEHYNPATGFTHFRLSNWDSLKDSKTVKEGVIKSYRCFKWTK